VLRMVNQMSVQQFEVVGSLRLRLPEACL
jgi:hypothetical protein